ncbi:hypothetical protein HYH03_017145 [Edaphochlamys debaryana]|uniref:RAP domain-containing protein n=1 Tax=Edaphochlamys debaryana TaxID=47281 RepID=A0A835XNA0_9CHLO|nr:hypothetical protein HYH03_017145 [Edaphochlamys debaryana]|eukprot:KAG2484055.1 hypothetical protein HYH03_017145 [Edaphochlamys debaryana]
MPIADSLQNRPPSSQQRALWLGWQLPPTPSPEALTCARRLLEEAGLCPRPSPLPGPPRGPHKAAQLPPSPQAPAASDGPAISAAVAEILLKALAEPSAWPWVRPALPELLLLLSRLRVTPSAALEDALCRHLRRGVLPRQPEPLWHALAAAGAGAGPTARHRRLGRVARPQAPPAFRLSRAMAAAGMAGHGPWQLLAERHLAPRHGGGAPVLEALGPEGLAQLAAAFAGAGYHPVQLFGAIADRLAPAAPRLAPASLARALASFASVRHHDPALAATLLGEASARLTYGGGGGGSSAGSAAAASRGGGGGGGGLLSRAGAALFGGVGGAGPDRAHRVPHGFALPQLAALAQAAVTLGPDGGGGGGGRVSEAAAEVLAAVAEEAEEAVGAYLVSRLERADRAAESGSQGGAPEGGPADPTAGAISLPYANPEGVQAAASSAEGAGEEEATDDYGGARGESLTSDADGGDEAGGSGGPAAWLAPVYNLLSALVAGGAAAGPTSPPALAAAAVAFRHLATPAALATAEPHLTAAQLATLLAALLPDGAAAAAGAEHPYPMAPPPPYSRIGPTDAVEGSSSRSTETDASAEADAVAAVAAALRRRADPATVRGGVSLLAAWHTLAAARSAAGSGGTAAAARDPRAVQELLPAVAAAAASDAGRRFLLTAAEPAARFVVSCALLEAYDRTALDAAAVPLMAALGGGGSAATATTAATGGSPRPGRYTPAAAAAAPADACGYEPSAQRLGPRALAQLAWAVGQLAYGNEALLGAIQAQALALSPPVSLTAPLDPLAAPRHGRSQPLARAALSEPDGDGDGVNVDGGAAGALVRGPGPLPGPAGPLLGPLELGDVLWALAANGYRTNQGAELRALYMRAATQGVVSIDDPRWLALARTHVLLLTGWGGGLGRAAAGLRSSWFNALGYAWERQAVRRGEHLAGSQGLPLPLDTAAAAFVRSVEATAADVARGRTPTPSRSPSGPDVDGEAGARPRWGGGWGGLARSEGGGGGWRLSPMHAWAMPNPSPDIRLTIPLLARRRGGGGAGGGGEVAIALDLTCRADEALTTAPSEPTAPSAEARSDVGAGTESEAEVESGPTGLAAVSGPGGGPSVAPLLGPARWRRLVLRGLGMRVRPLRQADWEAATPAERAELVRNALQS